MLLFFSTPELLSEVAHLEHQLNDQASKAPIAEPTEVVQTMRPKLSMVWHKELDGKRERLIARWVVDATVSA